MSSEKEEASGSTSARCEVTCWQQHSQRECKNSEMWGRCSRIQSQLASDNVLVHPSVLFSTSFQVQHFLFCKSTAA